MLSTLFIGDPHFQVDNIQDVEVFMSKVYTLLQAKNFDFVCILGDMLHTHEKIHSVPMNKAIEFVVALVTMTENVILLVGNHDMYSNQEYLNTNHWMNCLKSIPRVHVIDNVTKLSFHDMDFVFVPYVYPGKFKLALDSMLADWPSCKCVIAHQEFYGCSMGAIKSVDGDVWSEHYPPVISGHIHNNQKIEPNIYYPGSALQHSFGDTGKNIVAAVTFDPSDRFYKLDEIDLDLPRKKIIYSNVKDKITIPDVKQGDRVRMTISGNQDEFKAFKKSENYKKLVSGGIKVVFRPEKLDLAGNRAVKDEEVCVSDFGNILKKMVEDTKCPHVYSAYEMVVNDKEMK